MSDLLLILPNALDAATCRAAIEYFENSPRKLASGTGPAGGMHMVRRCHEVLLDQQGSGPLYQSVLGCLHRGLETYSTKYEELRRQPAVLEPFAIIRYSNDSEGYDWHSDGMDPGLRYRCISAVLYLNTVTEGGETEFRYQERKIPPQEGTLLFFPSGWTHIHRGCPPRSNPKYVIATWTRYGNNPSL